MKNLLTIFISTIAIISFSSCKISVPTFKAVEHLKFERNGLKGISIGADVVIHNPNLVSCKVSDLAVDVMLDKKKVGTLGKKGAVVIKPLSDFAIPVGLSIQPEGTIWDNIKSVIDMFTQKQAELSMLGKIKVKVFCKTYPIDIKFQQKISSGALKQ